MILTMFLSAIDISRDELAKMATDNPDVKKQCFYRQLVF